jgi:hypothetical protein
MRMKCESILEPSSVIAISRTASDFCGFVAIPGGVAYGSKRMERRFTITIIEDVTVVESCLPRSSRRSMGCFHADSGIVQLLSHGTNNDNVVEGITTWP